MADALLSPAVGSTMWAATAGMIGWSARQMRRRMDDRQMPLMGVLGAFVFAAQMINFTIPATGSSGHLGGGLLLAVLLGPCAAFLALASVLTVQSLFFADGGLLALGCNIFNLGVFPCFIAWPIYRQIVGSSSAPGRIAAGSIAAAVAGLQLGALAVVLETVLSGVSDLPVGAFLLLMQPIHLAIGVVEGTITALVVTFVWRASPEFLAMPQAAPSHGAKGARRVMLATGAAAVFLAGILSWFASTHPDGLEWSIARVAGRQESVGTASAGLHSSLARMQEDTAFLPDYGLPIKAEKISPAPSAEDKDDWPRVDIGTSLSGLIGGVMTLLLIAAIVYLLKRGAKNRNS